MKFLTRVVCKLNAQLEIRNVRSKFTKAAVLKTINEPLVVENFKISDSLKEGQVNYCRLFFIIISIRFIEFLA